MLQMAKRFARTIAAGVGLVLCGCAMQPVSAPASSPMNVATYNLRLNIASDGANAWPHRKEAVQALIEYHEIDLFGTQEGLPCSAWATSTPRRSRNRSQSCLRA